MATSTNGKAKSNGKAVAKNRIADVSVNAKDLREAVTITAPNTKRVAVRIRGISTFCQNKFSEKARGQMKAKQEAGSVGKKGTKREAKDFQACYEAAMYRGQKGEYGIPCAAFRNSMISACRLAGFQMTRAKQAVFVEPDCYDPESGTDLVQITNGEPFYSEDLVRNETGVCDLRPRPKWHPGWEATVRVRFDGDVMSVADVCNLLMRAGQQVGVGEGRPDSKKSCGQGWGMFEIVVDE